MSERTATGVKINGVDIPAEILKLSFRMRRKLGWVVRALLLFTQAFWLSSVLIRILSGVMPDWWTVLAAMVTPLAIGWLWDDHCVRKLERIADKGKVNR